MSWIGQATHLKAFPANEIAKGQYTMKLKQLVDSTKDMKWPVSNDHLPIVSWEDCECSPLLPALAFVELETDHLLSYVHLFSVQAESEHRPLMAVHGFIHDCSSFADERESSLRFDASPSSISILTLALPLAFSL